STMTRGARRARPSGSARSNPGAATERRQRHDRHQQALKRKRTQMAARIRLKRIGRKNRPSYRICVFDARTRRDGPPVEELRSYNPLGKAIDDKVRLDKDRALYWLSVGAQPSDTVKSFFRKLGVRKGQTA